MKVERVGKYLLYIGLVIVAVIQIFPLIWLFLFSLKDNREIFSGSPFALPTEFRWQNYQKVWEGGIGTYFWNSVWITALAILLTVILASMATFAITRMTWKLSGLVLVLCMICLSMRIYSSFFPFCRWFLFLNLSIFLWSFVIIFGFYNYPL